MSGTGDDVTGYAAKSEEYYSGEHISAMSYTANFD